MSRRARSHTLSDPEEARVRAREQALTDLAFSGGTEVVFVRHDLPSLGTSFVAEVLERAGKLGFLAAEVPLFGDRGFDALDSLVRAIARNIAAPGRETLRGLVALLEAFAEKRQKTAAEVFETRVELEGARGDLTELCRSYLAARTGPKRQAQRIDRWLSGTEIRRSEAADVEPVGALSPRTAKRTLAELSRLVRALGHEGMLLIFSGGEVLARLPEARRRNTYTVLRELIDNVDGGRGLVATEILVDRKSVV